MLEDKYNIPHDIAPKIYGIPYFIAAGASPALGFLIDKVGLRVHLSKNLINLTSYIVIGATSSLFAAHIITMMLPACDGCYT